MSAVHTGHIPYELESESAVAAPDGWFSRPDTLEAPARRPANPTGAVRLDGGGEAVIIVNDDLQVLFVSRPAEAVLAANDWLRIDALGTLRSDAGDLQALVASVCTSIDRARTPLTLERGPERAPLRIFAAPLHARDSATGATERRALMLVISDPEFEATSRKERLRMLFGLTPAEAAFAMEIVKGDGRRAAAQRRGIACSTARTHLSSIFEKTGTRRQAELVRLLLQMDAGQPNG
jgi:DNA-binding CsgD family transcriptional regulator